MKRFLFFLLLSVIVLGVHAQAPRKKCPTCGQSMAKCKYKGKHTKPNPTPQPVKPSPAKQKIIKAVDLGLPSGTKWAECNIGASAPEEYGYFYEWGVTTPKKGEHDWGNYFDSVKGSYTEFYKFYNDGGKTSLPHAPQYDVASRLLGENWHIPTEEQYKELISMCDWTWTKKNGINGYKVVGPNKNEIFLPAAGCKLNYVNNKGSIGEYWTNSLYKYQSSEAVCFSITSNSIKLDYTHRIIGLSIRAVKK